MRPDLTLHNSRVKLLQHVVHGDYYRDPEDDAHHRALSLPYDCSLAGRNYYSAQGLQESCQKISAESDLE